MEMMVIQHHSSLIYRDGETIDSITSLVFQAVCLPVLILYSFYVTAK